MYCRLAVALVVVLFTGCGREDTVSSSVSNLVIQVWRCRLQFFDTSGSSILPSSAIHEGYVGRLECPHEINSSTLDSLTVNGKSMRTYWDFYLAADPGSSKILWLRDAVAIGAPWRVAGDPITFDWGQLRPTTTNGWIFPAAETTATYNNDL